MSEPLQGLERDIEKLSATANSIADERNILFNAIKGAIRYLTLTDGEDVDMALKVLENALIEVSK